MSPTTWRGLLLVGATAAATVVGADLALGRLAPPVHVREVEDAMRDYRSADPEVLVLGSSHARTFATVDEILGGGRPGGVQVLAVPLEYGKLTGYRWVLENRIRPLVEELDQAGARKRRSLKHFVLVTEWWDSVPSTDEGSTANLPSRAWAWEHFVDDVAGAGVTEVNRNFLQSRWRRLFYGSALVQDRGHDSLLPAVKGWLRGEPDEETPAERDERLEMWREGAEGATTAVLDPEQVAAMRAVLAWAKSEKLGITVLLYPRMPSTLSDLAKRTTLARFAEGARAIAREFGATLIDHTTSTPLTDAEFAIDFDHLTPEGHRAYARYLLDGPLAFLREIAEGGSPR